MSYYFEKQAGLGQSLSRVGKRYTEMLTGSAKRTAKAKRDLAIDDLAKTKAKRDSLANKKRELLPKINAEMKELSNQFQYYQGLHDDALKQVKKIDNFSEGYRGLKNKAINDKNKLGTYETFSNGRKKFRVHGEILRDNYFNKRSKLKDKLEYEQLLKLKAQQDMLETNPPKTIQDAIMKIHNKDIRKAQRRLDKFEAYGNNRDNSGNLLVNNYRDKNLAKEIGAANDIQKTINSYDKVVRNTKKVRRAKQKIINNSKAELNKIKGLQAKKNAVKINIDNQLNDLAKQELDLNKSVNKARQEYGKENANHILTVGGTIGVGGFGINKARKAIQNKVNDKKGGNN